MHDAFNWLTVIVLLPVEVVTGYLFRVSQAIVNSTEFAGGGSKHKFFKVLTEPLTDRIVQVDRILEDYSLTKLNAFVSLQLDKSVLDDIATGDPQAANKSLLLFWCEHDVITLNETEVADDNMTASTVEPVPVTAVVGVTECRYLFHDTHLSEQAVGAILLVMSLTLLIGCLVAMVKILKSLLEGKMASVIKKTVNANFPGRWAALTGVWS